MARDVRAEMREKSAAGGAEAAKLAREAALVAARAGLDKKAENVKVLDVRGLTSYADFLVLMTATSDRQVTAIADAVEEQLTLVDYKPIGVEGASAGNWVLIDSADVVVHVFQAEARAFYDLDSLWADAKRLEVPAAPAAPQPTA